MKWLLVGALAGLAGQTSALVNVRQPRLLDGEFNGLHEFGGDVVEGLVLELEDDLEVVVDMKMNYDLVPSHHKFSTIDENGNVVDLEGVEHKMCHFLGRVRGEEDSSVGISFCGGKMEGCVLFRNGSHYTISHNTETNETVAHRMLDDHDEEGPMDTVMVQKYKTIVLEEMEKNLRQGGVTAAQISASELFLEVVVVSDPQRVAQFGGNLNATAEANLVVLGHVAAFLQKASFTVPVKVSLVQSVFFENLIDDFPTARTHPSTDSRNSTIILNEGNEWRRNNRNQFVQHDIIHYFSGKNFLSPTIGLAFLGSACDDRTLCSGINAVPEGFCAQSGNTLIGCCLNNALAISMVSNSGAGRALFSAATVVHEMGHQLSFNHDSQGDAAGCAASGFIMAAVAGVVGSNPDWSACSEAKFSVVFNQGNTQTGYHPYQCLTNKPGETIDPRDDGAGSSPSNTDILVPVVASVGAVAVLGLLFIVYSCTRSSK